MQVGTIRRMRDLAMRQGPSPRIRDARQRRLPTKHGHAGLCSGFARVIRGYKSDSSSKRPVSSFLRRSRPRDQIRSEAHRPTGV